jgi:chorismate synthase
VINAAARKAFMAEISAALEEGDSVGGVVECAAAGVPAGIGDPIFGGVESRLAAALFGIPALKGLEFGEGFGSAKLRGSENNDSFYIAEGGQIKTETNRHGGILGGITSGMPIVLRAAFKPTPSIFKPQKTVDLERKTGAQLEIKGRHDPCVALRAVPVVEAMTAVCLIDMMMGAKGID